MADATPQTSLTSVVEWRKFLADFPPGTRGSVEGAIVRSDGSPKFTTPELQLYCDECSAVSYCSGQARIHSQSCFPISSFQASLGGQDAILFYLCTKCAAWVKSYAVRAVGEDRGFPTADVAKLGEWPTFSYQTPAKLMSLIGPDREKFLKGRRAECESLGIGAFAYYRQIVENQKNRLLAEIERVARKTGAPQEMIDQLQAAQQENQFKRAVEAVKDAIPPSLLIAGQNPLTLLHRALSRNLHDGTDEECLCVARDVRLVLCELAENLGRALKDERELSDAVSRLLKS